MGGFKKNRILFTVMNDGYIDGHCIIELLNKIKAQYSLLPITLILENVPYQKCDAVKKEADLLKIELLFLPPYSPNLNLIERLWKYVKKDCLNSKYHMTFDEFKTVIMDCITNKDEPHSQALSSLLTLKFQMFPKHMTPEPKPEKRVGKQLNWLREMFNYRPMAV